MGFSKRPWSIANSVLGALAFLALLFVWPLAMLASAMLVITTLMFVSIYAAARQARHHHAAGWRRVDREVPIGMAAALVVGIVASFVWPASMAVVALAATFVACTAWIAYELITHNASRARGDGRR